MLTQISNIRYQNDIAKFKVKRFWVLLCKFAFWILIFGFLSGCLNRQLYRDNQVLMGTFVEVISPDKRAAGIAFNEIKRIEALLSKYRTESEISNLNKYGKLRVSSETFYILKKAKAFWLISGGAFDITVGPLMDLWGFTTKQYRLPKKTEIAKNLKLIGSEKIILNQEYNVVKFSLRGMKIDLGAIAKGYAVDCAIKELRKQGIKSCLISAGGDIYCLGDKFGQPWKVAIKDPRQKGIFEYLELKDKAVATSGDYEQYFIQDRKRYAHILNPKTGYPAESGVISVTVVAPDGLTADVLATTIFVLGKEEGLNLTRNFPGVKAKIINE